jgi:hypothetical protein
MEMRFFSGKANYFLKGRRTGSVLRVVRRKRAEKRREVEEFGPLGVLSTIFYGRCRDGVR